MLGDWNEAHKTAQELIRVIPDEIKSWLNRSNALRYMEGGGVQAAYEALLPGERKFNENYLFYFHLARYACQAGRLDEARQWLGRANGLGGIKELALDEADLESLSDYVDRLDSD